MPVLPHEYQMTGTDERALLFDSGVVDITSTFISATSDGIDMLANSSQWFGDGPFKLCRQILSQIYTIHALLNHGVLLCVFPHGVLHYYRLKLKLYVSNFSQR